MALEGVATVEALGSGLEQARVPEAQVLVSALERAERAERATEAGPGQEMEWALVAVLDSGLGAAAGAAVQPTESLERARRSGQFRPCD